MTMHAVTDEQRLIDCDAEPFIPEGWQFKPEDQIPGAVSGQIEFDPAKIIFYLDDQQKDGKSIVGDELKKQLAGKPLLKANVLDHLLANKILIPESWEPKETDLCIIYFWGTIYRSPDGLPCVRYLCWRFGGGGWGWGYYYLGAPFGGRSPAALLASCLASVGASHESV